MLNIPINKYYYSSEEKIVKLLLNNFHLTAQQQTYIKNYSTELVEKILIKQKNAPITQKIMTYYDLSSAEGKALMALCEALIRTPDQENIAQLIKDKLENTNFLNNLSSASLINKTISSSLLLASKFMQNADNKFVQNCKNKLHNCLKPLTHKVVMTIIKRISEQFIIAESIDKAISQTMTIPTTSTSYSFDMLGESVCTMQDAKKYFHDYLFAIETIGSRIKEQSNSISIKLSALHPRYEYAQQDTIISELSQKLKTLAIAAQKAGVDLTIDAEKSEHLEISLEIFRQIFICKEFKNWHGLGLAVQAYQKRSLDVIDWLEKLAIKYNKKIPIRLVKGAYWDTEIKNAQENGLRDYPVFTRKSTTDLAYLACVQKLFNNANAFFPQIATHNAHTVAAVLAIKKHDNFEFQRLFGAGQELYDSINHNIKVRIYAPVGKYEQLLPYLVRRILENGANSSFVKLISKAKVDINSVIRCPWQITQKLTTVNHPQIATPPYLFKDRKNSLGICLSYIDEIEPIYANLNNKPKNLISTPIIAGKAVKNLTYTDIISPLDGAIIGKAYQADVNVLQQSLVLAQKDQPIWENHGIEHRAMIVEKIADLFEQHKYDFINLCIYEAGKTIDDAIVEIREAIDFCRYYAQQAREVIGKDIRLPSVTGEENTLSFTSRGIFLCISPWNFPLAIFTGQIVAALVMGNAVLAKPASQTTLIANLAIKLMLKAGIPATILQLVTSSGALISQEIISSCKINGVCFTGSTATAHVINRTLAANNSSIIPFIAETGGQNVMLVDSTALPEQVVKDVISSAFKSAGQRCSALRILLLQQETADKIIAMLKGAMAELIISNKINISTDIGPIIDKQSKDALLQHIKFLQQNYHEIYSCSLSNNTSDFFVAPCAYEIPELKILDKEHFGPILHVIRFSNDNLDTLINEINDLGFGLTFGIHSRIDNKIATIARKLKIGNIYVNRSIVGAVVQSQPFGGCNLSGTGPKAGGPNYLQRFAVEKTVSINITDRGGDTSLLTV